MTAEEPALPSLTGSSDSCFISCLQQVVLSGHLPRDSLDVTSSGRLPGFLLGHGSALIIIPETGRFW